MTFVADVSVNFFTNNGQTDSFTTQAILPFMPQAVGTKGASAASNIKVVASSTTNGGDSGNTPKTTTSDSNSNSVYMGVMVGALCVAFVLFGALVVVYKKMQGQDRLAPVPKEFDRTNFA